MAAPFDVVTAVVLDETGEHIVEESDIGTPSVVFFADALYKSLVVFGNQVLATVPSDFTDEALWTLARSNLERGLVQGHAAARLQIVSVRRER